MKITTLHPDEDSFGKVLERFNKAADAREIPREQAMIAAMLLWLGSDATTWVSDAEWLELSPELERIRSRDRAPGGVPPESEPGSSDRGPGR